MEYLKICPKFVQYVPLSPQTWTALFNLSGLDNGIVQAELPREAFREATEKKAHKDENLLRYEKVDP